MRSADSECTEQLRDPCSPPPLLHILQGGLWAEQSLTPTFPDVPGTGTALGPQGKAPSLDKTTLGCQSFSADGGGDENTEPSAVPSKVCRVPSCPEGRSQRAPLLESRAESTGALHHCGQIGLGGQETTSLLGPVPSEAARIPWHHSSFCTLGNFVSSWRTTIFNP